MRVRAVAFFLALAPLAFQSKLFAQSSEVAYFLDQAPVMYYKNTVYTTPTLTFISSVPPSKTSVISLVGYTWAFSNSTPPKGTVVKICDTDVTRHCLDVSSTQQGSSYFFQGLSAYTANFTISFEVPGTGPLNPVLYPSNQDQFIVNYSY